MIQNVQMQDVSNLLGYFESTERAPFDSEMVQIFRKKKKKLSVA